jgi:hypothetical protein
MAIAFSPNPAPVTTKKTMNAPSGSGTNQTAGPL